VLPLHYAPSKSVQRDSNPHYYLSGWQDSNLRLLGSKPSTLARLSYIPERGSNFDSTPHIKYMKTCTRCEQTKPLEDFYKKSGRVNATMSQCKSCFNQTTHERQKNNKSSYVAYLGGKCVVCGYDRCYQALDFHHLDPSTKEINLSSGRGYSFDRAKRELDKCVLVCSNCHREIHAGIVPPPGIEPGNAV
jgi:hypothetical protein